VRELRPLLGELGSRLPGAKLSDILKQTGRRLAREAKLNPTAGFDKALPPRSPLSGPERRLPTFGPVCALGHSAGTSLGEGSDRGARVERRYREHLNESDCSQS
jgi:hypothetical protein